MCVSLQATSQGDHELASSGTETLLLSPCHLLTAVTSINILWISCTGVPTSSVLSCRAWFTVRPLPGLTSSIEILLTAQLYVGAYVALISMTYWLILWVHPRIPSYLFMTINPHVHRKKGLKSRSRRVLFGMTFAMFVYTTVYMAASIANVILFIRVTFLDLRVFGGVAFPMFSAIGLINVRNYAHVSVVTAHDLWRSMLSRMVSWFGVPGYYAGKTTQRR